MARTRRRSARRTTKSAKRTTRRNPNVGRAYVTGLTGTPAKAMALFQGPKAVRNTAYAFGGLLATYVVGGMVSEKFGGLIGRTPLGGNFIGQRILPALVPYTIGFAGSRMVKDQQVKTALMVGGGVASVIELLMPGQVGKLLSRVPGMDRLVNGSAGPEVADVVEDIEEGPVQQAQEGIGRVMLAGYVSDQSYRGAGAYVAAPGYSGTAGQPALAEYVQRPSYSGTEGLGQETLAGNYLEDSNMFSPAI